MLVPPRLDDPSPDHLQLSAGALLFAAGETGSAAYLVEKGCLEIFLPRPEGDLVLARRGPGEIVGEMAILDHLPRSASVRAREESTLVVVTEENLVHRIGETDPILRMFLGVVLQRYRETVAMLEGIKGAGPGAAPAVAAQPEFAGALETLVLEREIRSGLARSEFELFFQPIVRLGSARLAGFEALLRWRHPERGLVPPIDFIPVAESCGLIGDLTGRVLEEVGRHFPAIALAGLGNPHGVDGPLFMSLNVSGQDLAGSAFPDAVAQLLDRSGIPARSLRLEVTESALMKNPAEAAKMLVAFREAGFGIAIDDFGTGYSSLSYLGALPATTLKIDRGFVRTMLSEPTSRRIVQTMLRLAEELGISVVAEGIEEPEQAQALIELGCDYGQGYLFGRPTPIDATLSAIRAWNAWPEAARPAA